MTRDSLGRLALLALLCWIICGAGLSERGLVGPDEPRYAAIAHEMAVSGDWVTPRLWGDPWFEKPALLYWMGAAAETLGIGGDLATRVPVALLSFAFLVCFHFFVRRSFGLSDADGATLVLATVAGWAAYSQVGVFDLPVAAATGVALLALLPWVKDSSQKQLLPLFGAALGIGVLAKGLVAPAVAFLALLSVCRDRGIGRVAGDMFSARTLVPFGIVTLPWYGLCYWRNGTPFVEEFLWRHHVLRLFSSELQHVQPWWFYVPVLLIGLAPWTPLAITALTSTRWREESQMRFLAAWALGALLLFSVSTNKLPGYILPAVPPLCLIAARGLRRAPAWAWGCAGLLLCLFPLAASVLPGAMEDGLAAAWPPASIAWALSGGFVAVALAAAFSASKGRTLLATGLIATGATFGYWNLKTTAFSDLDRAAGSRAIWMEIRDSNEPICLGKLRRHVEYGLRYYSEGKLKPCKSSPAALQMTGDPPRREAAPDRF